MISLKANFQTHMRFGCGCLITRKVGSEDFVFIACNAHSHVKASASMKVADLEKEILFGPIYVPSAEPAMSLWYCGKCKQNFNTKKDLKAHKVKVHSY